MAVSGGQEVTWPDLSGIGVYLGSYRDATRESGFSLVDTSGKFSDAIQGLGFDPAEGSFGDGIWVLRQPSAAITPGALKRAFGEANVRFLRLSREEVNRRFQTAVRTRTKMNSNAFFAQQRAVGMNHLGEMVMESVGGRFILRRKGEAAVVVREDPIRSAEFLRVRGLEDLRQVADGFVQRITRKGEKLGRKNVELLREVSNEAGFSPREYQEAIEAAINRLFQSEVVSAGVRGLVAYDVANRIYLGMPELNVRTATSITHQQYSTPMPMATLAQVLLAPHGVPAGASVLEPTIGNAALTTLLNGAKVYGVEIDEARVKEAARGAECVLHGDATTTSFRSVFDQAAGFDFVIANPPFGGLDQKVDVRLPGGSSVPVLEVGRLDHLILLRALHARKDHGRAVFITGADSAMGDGEIKGRSRRVLNYLADHYHVDGIVDVAGELFKKQGAEFPLRLYVIGDRRAQPEETQTPERLPVIHSYDGLREWAAQLMAGQPVPVEDIQAPARAPKAPRERQVVANEADSVLDVLQAAEEEAAEAAPMPADAPQVDEREESAFQQPYVAFSNVGEPSTMMPANLSGPVYEALTRIKERHGDVDEFVARELDYPVADLGKYFSPEQVDAIAMIFAAHNQNLGFLLADQMGVGKGRVLAAVARRERLQGRIPTFVTVKDNLFSDFLERDLAAIDSRELFKNPFIINDGSKTVDANGDVVVRALKRDVYRKFAETGELPPETDLILLTYSQICRRPESHLTSRYMGFLAERYPLTLLLDESHNGAGASNTGENLCYMIDALGRRGNVVYSSGTPIKGAKNLRLYTKVLPAGADPEELLEVVKSDPLSLQEALNYEIAAQGCLISRELNSIGINKEFALSPRVERNRAIADQMAEILTAMSYMSGDVSRAVTKLNKEFIKEAEKVAAEDRAGNRMMASSMNFGSRLYNINRQFLLALKAADVVEYALQALEDNRKPIIALQHTGESLLVDFVTQANEEYDTDPDRVQKNGAAVVLDTPVTFKDLMRKYLERIQWVKFQGRYGDVSYQSAGTLSDDEDAREAYARATARIAEMIDALPDDLPLTPIDYVRHELGKAGYTVGEISGRNLRVSYRDAGGVVIEPVPNRGDKTRVNRAVREFNNGDLDVLVLTGAGSTGLSVQASPAVGRDVRPRRMIKWEMQPDIAQERQIDGRHNRTGQVVPPEYQIPMTGLPADDRLAMMFNNKNRSLTSSSVSNRDSKELIREIPDLLNAVGDEVAQHLLMGTPSLAQHLDISLPKDPEEIANKAPLWWINQLTGRISLLRVAEQEALYGELQSRFTERLDQLKAEGKNPLEVECHDWRARTIAREVFMGEEKADKADSKSQFRTPVYMSEVEYDVETKAVRASEIDEKIAANQQGMDIFAGSEEGKEFAHIIEFIQGSRNGFLTRELGRKHPTVEEALADEESNAVKLMAAKLDWLEENLPRLGHGSVYMDRDLEGRPVPHVILRANQPGKRDGYVRPSDYTLYVMRPGSDLVTLTTLSTLFSRGVGLENRRFRDHPFVRAEFDNAQNGLLTKKARLIDGNLFEAVALNLRERIGQKIVYTDETGARQHGILVHSDVGMRRLAQLAEKVRDPELLADLVKVMPITTSSQGVYGGREAAMHSVVQRERGEYFLRVPGSKANGGDIFLDPVLSRISGKEKENVFGLDFEQKSGKMVASVPEWRLVDVLRYLVQEKNMNFYIKDREALRKVRESRSGKRAEACAAMG